MGGAGLQGAGLVAEWDVRGAGLLGRSGRMGQSQRVLGPNRGLRVETVVWFEPCCAGSWGVARALGGGLVPARLRCSGGGAPGRRGAGQGTSRVAGFW